MDSFKKILIAPDKFKDSLTSFEVCEAVAEGIQKVLPNAEIVKFPLADGGDGSLDILHAKLNFNIVSITVNDPLFNEIESYYGFYKNIAFIEMAKVSGLQLIEKEKRSANLTTSFGTGEMIRDAIERGIKNVYLFIGGSATNDAGIGLAAALGYRFLNEKGENLKPIGKNLIHIHSIDNSEVISLNDINVKVFTDVKNVFYGKHGAAYQYAAQKGATEEEIINLDNGLRNLSAVINRSFNVDISEIPGSGAAGGLGGGAIAFCNAELQDGIDYIMDLLKINDTIKESDFVITGEGKLDGQSLQGKTIHGIVNSCKNYNKPVGIICGISLIGESALGYANARIKQIKTEDISMDESQYYAYQFLVERGKELVSEMLTIQKD